MKLPLILTTLLLLTACFQSFEEYEDQVLQERYDQEYQQLELAGDEYQTDTYYDIYTIKEDVVLNARYVRGNGQKQFIMKQAHPATFEALQREWAKDQNNVYFDGLIIEKLDSHTFQILGDTKYLKDKNGVYRENIQGDTSLWVLDVEGADPSTFGPYAQ